MPPTIGLLPSQQESFEHHEELSKLSHETDVFYVPFQTDFHNNNDLSDLTKRFDEDILNKHLVVTFRDIGYSLFLDSVQSVPDQNDKTKVHISGKMIVDGICIQFLGRFDSSKKPGKHSEVEQINGVGKVILDEDYYQQLLSSSNIVVNDKFSEEVPITDSYVSQPKTRARTISENVLGKSHTHILKSPPSSLPNSQSRLHSPYTIRSPRTTNNLSKQQYQASSPINIENSLISKSSGFQSSFISPSSSVTSSLNENQTDSFHHHLHQQTIRSPSYSSSFQNSTTLPRQIPFSTAPNTGLPIGSLPHLTGIFPINESHSLPTYFLPQTGLTYFVTNSNRLLSSFNPHSLQLTTQDYPLLSQGKINSFNDHITLLQNKRHDNDENDSNNNKQIQSMDTSKSLEEQLPLKKRRYTSQDVSKYSPININHQDDDDDTSNESMKN